MYSIWRVCERFHIRPPELKTIDCWDSLDTREQSTFLAYQQIREYEEMEEVAALAGVKLQ